MTIFKVYASRGDGGERGVGPIIAFHSSKDLAESHAKGRGFYGGNGGITVHHAIKVDSLTYVLLNDQPVDIDGIQARIDSELRSKTLASLTADQKRVLGLC